MRIAGAAAVPGEMLEGAKHTILGIRLFKVRSRVGKTPLCHKRRYQTEDQ